MTYHPRFVRSFLAAICTGFFTLSPGISQAWTNKPLKLIVPAPPGGTQDAVARALADELTQEIQQTVIVENKPGAGGVLAVQALNAAPPDGNS